MNKLKEIGPRLIVERQSPDLRNRLWQLIDDAKGDDVLAPVTVVGPSRYANLSLRQELGLRGFANVRFIVMPVLSELLGAATLAQAGRRPLTAALEGVAIRAALAEATGELASVSTHAATLASARSSFRELRRAPKEVNEALGRQGGVRSEVVKLFRRFRDETAHAWYDEEDLAEAAVQAVLEGRTAGLDELGLIVFFLPSDMSPAETRLIEALAAEGRSAVVLGTTGDRSADAPGFSLQNAPGPFLSNAVPDVADADEPLLPPGEASLHVAPSAHEELRWVIRQVVAEASDNGTPFHRMAILYRADNPYASLIPDELRLAGIPMAGPGVDTLADTAPGRTLLGLMTLAEGKFRRDDVMPWLTGCPVSPPAGRTPGFNPSYWDSLSRRAGIVGGLQQWQDRLTRHARDLERNAERRHDKGEISDGRARQMRYEAVAARNALAFINLLSGDVTPPSVPPMVATGGGAPSPIGNWAAHCEWARRLMDTYLSRDLSESDSQAEDRIKEFLEGLAAADSIDPVTDLEIFTRTLREALAAPIGQLGPTGSGVFVSRFANACGMRFDAVWLVGMIEGAVPPAVRPDPLLPEAGWQAAGGASRAAQRAARERGDYLSALASAPRRTLSYPVADGNSQRQSYPSRWFLEQASVLEGRQIYSGDLAGLSDRPWLTATPSSVIALANAPDSALADEHDYLLHRLLQWKSAGRRLAEHPLVLAGSAGKAIRLERARAGRSRNLGGKFTEFDGNLSAATGAAGVQLAPANSPVSATSLEAWATCPFRYFLGHILRLSALESPEDTATISALERGSLMHDILEEFTREIVGSGRLPAPSQPWSPEHRNLLKKITRSHFEDAEQRGVTGRPLLWDLARQEILDDLETFLEEDAILRRQHGTVALVAEANFGAGGDSPVVQEPDTGLFFRGRIDRIDLAENGKSALVIDYKTGSPRPYSALDEDAIDRGKRLQLGVYSLAARRLFPEASQVQAAYWFTRTVARPRFAPSSYFDIDDSESGDRFRHGIASIIDGITSGLFPARPGPWVSHPERPGHENCRYCDFNSLCPTKRGDLWQRKKSDPSIGVYFSLSGEDEEE